MQIEPPTLTEDATATKRAPGRPPIITLPVVEQISRLIAKGMTEEQSCLRVGVNHSSFRTARHRNEQFETVIKKAQADFLDVAIDAIFKGKPGWQAMAWLLERRYGDQFRRTSGMEVTAHVGPFNPTDILMRKPLHAWTANDVEQSVGAWKLLKKWPKEQLEQLHSLYESHWGPYDEWTDEQLEWAVEIEKCMHGNASTPALPEQASRDVELVIG